MSSWSWPRQMEARLKGKPPSTLLFRQSVLLLFACFVFAIILWMYVSGLEPDADPNRTVTREVAATIHYTQSHTSVVSSDTATVNVTLQGTSAALDHASIRVWVDLSNVTTPGDHNLPVNVQTFDPDVTGVATPDHVHVFLDNNKTHVLQLALHNLNQPPPGYVAGIPVLDPDTVTIIGPSTLIGAAHAYADFDLKNMAHSVDVTLDVHLSGIPDASAHLFSVKPSKVGLFLPIERRISYASLPVIPHLINLPPPGYELRRVQVTPPTVTVSGPPGLMDDLGNIPTNSINIGGATRTFGGLVELAPPAGVHVEGGGTVRIHVEIGRAPHRLPPIEQIPQPPAAEYGTSREQTITGGEQTGGQNGSSGGTQLPPEQGTTGTPVQGVSAGTAASHP